MADATSANDAQQERALLAAALRQHVALDLAFGVEFLPRSTTQLPELPARTLTRVETATRPAQTAVPRAPVTMPTLAVSLPTDDSMQRIVAEIAACTACGLCRGRTNTVPGEGPAAAKLVFVGEGPGADEDATGRPFVGEAGQLLDKMIVAMGLRREDVFILNVIKCRPPGNRTPEANEIAACVGYLHRQLAVLKPSVICALGNTPLRALTGDLTLGITSQRGKQRDYRGIPMIPTFHPAYLLRNPSAKKQAWEDLKLVLSVLGQTPPARS